jgi:hypothetical protein
MARGLLINRLLLLVTCLCPAKLADELMSQHPRRRPVLRLLLPQVFQPETRFPAQSLCDSAVPAR